MPSPFHSKLQGESPRPLRAPPLCTLLSGIDPGLALISVPTSLLSTQLAMSIFLAGAGAPGPNQPGKDGNPKCPPEARVFALQVVDALLGDKSKVDGLPLEQKQAVEQAFLQFV